MHVQMRYYKLFVHVVYLLFIRNISAKDRLPDLAVSLFTFKSILPSDMIDNLKGENVNGVLRYLQHSQTFRGS